MKSLFSGRGRQAPAERWRDWVESLSVRLPVPQGAMVPVRIRRGATRPWIRATDGHKYWRDV
jgi:hypothetical protein